MENEDEQYIATLYDNTSLIFQVPYDAYHNDTRYLRTGISEIECLLFDNINGEFNTDATYIYDKPNQQHYIHIIDTNVKIQIKEIKKI